MKERPILFSGAMVRALLDGSKTQTRRIAKPSRQYPFEFIGSGTKADPDWNDPSCWGFMSENGDAWLLKDGSQESDVHQIPCPHGQPGDRLWVRETWGVISNTWDDDGEMTDWVPDRPVTAINEMPFGGGYYCGHVIYAADGPNEWAGDDDGGGEPRSAWHPSIHMPRLASRILRDVTGVRVERLNDISEADAIAEGICKTPSGFWSTYGQHDVDGTYNPIVSYRCLWESINGAGSWAANPWVRVVEFKRVAHST